MSAVPSPRLDAQPEFIHLPGEMPSPAKAADWLPFSSPLPASQRRLSRALSRDDCRINHACGELPPLPLASPGNGRQQNAAFRRRQLWPGNPPD
ncbi:MAG: hypothetical protein V5B44_25620 [Candidatus Accumulibacter necessarius]|uniref:hypothetical protein n=1 Tax=Candidatus Accumulibacter necessarius TaxID=2954386 RepID=UPI002FC29ECB